MSVTDWKLEKDLCRCCHAEGSFKNLSVPCYKYDGEEEIYVDMIRDHMNLDIIQVQGALQSVTFTICDLCIAKLRDVTTFRRQVMSCEERFRDMYSRNVFKVGETTPDVKVEVIELDDFGDVKGEDNDDDDFTMNFSDEEDIKAEVLIDIKQEPSKKGKGKGKATPKAKKRPAPKRAAKAKKGKKAGGDGEEDKVDDADKAEDEAEATASLADTTKRASKRGSFVAVVQRAEYRSNDDNTLTCVRCEVTRHSRDSIVKHIKMAHHGWRPHQCDHCPESFTVSSEYHDHMIKEHGQDKRIQCPACDVKVLRLDRLRVHISKHHKKLKNLVPRRINAVVSRNEYRYNKETKTYTCTQCGVTHGYVRLMNHIKVEHHGVKPFNCDKCEESFIMASKYHDHMIQTHGIDNRIACLACDAKVMSPSALAKHMKAVHKLGQIRKCDQCSFETTCSSTFHAHQEVHVMDRKFSCSFCTKTFKSKKDVTHHEMLHTRKKTHACHLCSKSFFTNGYLNFHLKKSHGIGVIKARGPPTRLRCDGAKKNTLA